MTFRPIAIAAMACSLCFVACGGGQSPPPQMPPPASTAAPVVPPGEAKVGDKTRCPVSGEEFVVSAQSPKVEHEGKTYYFCCPGCDKKFGADPKKFLGKPAS